MIIRVFRPTIHPGKESEFESDTWTGHYETIETD